MHGKSEGRGTRKQDNLFKKKEKVAGVPAKDTKTRLKRNEPTKCNHRIRKKKKPKKVCDVRQGTSKIRLTRHWAETKGNHSDGVTPHHCGDTLTEKGKTGEGKKLGVLICVSTGALLGTEGV